MTALDGVAKSKRKDCTLDGVAKSKRKRSVCPALVYVVWFDDYTARNRRVNGETRLGAKKQRIYARYLGASFERWNKERNKKWAAAFGSWIKNPRSRA